MFCIHRPLGPMDCQTVWCRTWRRRRAADLDATAVRRTYQVIKQLSRITATFSDTAT